MRFRWTALVSLAGAGLIVAHWKVVQAGPAYTGPLRALDSIFVLVAALTLAGLCATTGGLILRRRGCGEDFPVEDLCVRLAVGAGVVATLLLALGFSGLLGPTPIALLFLGLVLIGRREVSELGRLLRSCRLHVQRGYRGGWPIAAAATVLAGIVLFLAVQSLAPPTDWDSLMYHLRVPAQFLDAGRVLVPEDNLHVAYVGLVQMLYIPLLLIGAPAGCAVLSALFALVLGLLVFTAGVRLLDRISGVLGSILVIATPILLLVAITPRIDVTLVLYTFLAHYMLLLILLRKLRPGHLQIAALVLGLAVGVKYHALFYALGLAPLILWIAWSYSGRSVATVRTLALCGLFAAIGAAPWLLKNLALLGAPLYPALTSDLVLQPWLAPIFGASSVPTDIDRAIYGAVSYARSPFQLSNVLDLVFAPGKLTVEGEGLFYYASPALLGLVLWPAFLRHRTLNWLVLPPLAYFLLVVVPFEYTNLRYLIPAFAPLTLAAVYMMVQIARRFLSARPSLVLAFALTALALIPTGKTVYHWMTDRAALQVTLGFTSTEEYLARGFGFYKTILDAVHRTVPPDGKALLLFEARGYYFTRPVIQDNVLTNWPLLASRLDGEGCLEATEISHVVVSTLALRYYILRGMDPEILGLSSFPDFEGRCLRLVYRVGGLFIYEIDPASIDAAPVTAPIEIPSMRTDPGRTSALHGADAPNTS